MRNSQVLASMYTFTSKASRNISPLTWSNTPILSSKKANYKYILLCPVSTSNLDNLITLKVRFLFK